MKTNMFKLSILAVGMIMITSIMTSCTFVNPKAGEESVLVKQPWFFGHGGVVDEPVSTGSQWCAPTTNAYEFSIVPQTVTEDFTNLISSDNTPVSFSAYLKLQITPGQSPNLYKNFGKDWYAHSLQATFRTMVRDKSSAYKMFELASKRDVSSKIEVDLFKDLSDYAKKINLPVTIMQVSIGAVTPPESVLSETKNTAAQNQSILTQQARANAELSRKQAETNKAIADKAYETQMGMSVAEYLHLRQLEIEKEKVELIKDHPNLTIVFGNSTPQTYSINK